MILELSVAVVLASALGAQRPAEPPKPPKPRVLLVAGAPHFEYRYLKNVLLRDRGLVVHTFLCSAGEDFVQERSGGAEPLTDLPRTLEAMRRFDVVLLGDVPLKALGATVHERNAFVENLLKLVEFGGGVGFLFGADATTEEYRETVLRHIMPAKLEAAGHADAPTPGSLRAIPSRNDLAERLTRIDGDEEVWRKLPLVLARYPVAEVNRRGTKVLIGEKRTDSIVAAAGTWQLGRTFYLGIDATWRWRANADTAVHAKFWRNVVRYLGVREAPKQARKQR